MHVAPKAASAWLSKVTPADGPRLTALVSLRMQVQRLKTREQFQAVLAGFTLARTEHFVIHSRTPMSAPPSVDHLVALAEMREGLWMGAMVPKRCAKRAVTRNLIKRQIYSMANAFQMSLPLGAHVVRMRAGFDRQQFISASSDKLKKAVHAEIEQLFNRAISHSLTPKPR